MVNAAFVSPIALRPHNVGIKSTSLRRPVHVHRATLSMKVDVASTSQVRTVDVFKDTFVQIQRSSPRLPIIVVPGYGADASEYEPMASLLREQLGASSLVSVVPIRALTWAKTIGGLPVTPILHALDACVKNALAQTGAKQVNIVAHSAAGWISRIYMGDAAYPDGPGGRVWSGMKHVDTLICLGTPQKSSEPVTLKNMTFVNEKYPGAFHNDVRYINIGGDGVIVSESDEGGKWRFWEKEWFARTSYALTDGDSAGQAVEGDGIVPLSATFLDGAEANIRMKGVWHSPSSRGPWYGHEAVVKYWSQFLK